MKVDVVIPTMGRPDGLAHAVRSLFTTANAAAIRQLIVVDNDPARSAQSTVENLTRSAPFPICYVTEPRAGVATARNAGMAACADATYIAFLDDDEIASSLWLNALIDTAEALAADVVFGPIQGVAPSAVPHLRPTVETFFSRTGPNTTQMIKRSYGCGNSLLRMFDLIGPAPFDVATNETGGEDDELFARLASQGAVFAWAAEALVEEHVPANRSTLGYLLTRAFARGQGPSQTAASQGHWVGLLGWTLIGLGQTVVYGTVAFISRPFSSRRSSQLALKAAEGLGKIFWFKWFEPKLYGLAELKSRALGSGD